MRHLVVTFQFPVRRNLKSGLEIKWQKVTAKYVWMCVMSVSVANRWHVVLFWGLFMDQQPAPCKISEIKLRLSQHFVQSSQPSPFVSVRRDGVSVFMCLFLVTCPWSDSWYQQSLHFIGTTHFSSASDCISANCITASRVVSSVSAAVFYEQSRRYT